ncbi:MAG: hypothetical protein IKK47_05315 [Ruminococcus sp.]|nr:hypothetical protein [Ruminococcus sp.]
MISAVTSRKIFMNIVSVKLHKPDIAVRLKNKKHCRIRRYRFVSDNFSVHIAYFCNFSEFERRSIVRIYLPAFAFYKESTYC